jgi:hypothetical protein
MPRVLSVLIALWVTGSVPVAVSGCRDGYGAGCLDEEEACGFFVEGECCQALICREAKCQVP